MPFKGRNAVIYDATAPSTHRCHQPSTHMEGEIRNGWQREPDPTSATAVLLWMPR